MILNDFDFNFLNALLDDGLVNGSSVLINCNLLLYQLYSILLGISNLVLLLFLLIIILLFKSFLKLI